MTISKTYLNINENTIILLHPLDQFELVELWGIWSGILIPAAISTISNLSIILGLNILIIRLLSGTIICQGPVNIYNYIVKNIYRTVKNVLRNNTTLKRSQYFSIIFYLFIFIFISNITGLIPYSFTVTSSFLITFFIALSHFTGINIIGFVYTRWKTFTNLLPGGVPMQLTIPLVGIESISHSAKVLSLSIRLFANMMAGHALLKILISFAWSLLLSPVPLTFVSVVPWIVVTIIFFLEALIAFLQAFVFVVLTTIYINDIVSSH